MVNEQAVLAADNGVGVTAVNASPASSSVSSGSNLTSDSASDNANSGKNMSTSIFDDDDDEEGDVCRICRNPGDADNPLRYPCACSGSIKFVHQDCLLQWLNHSNARQCEVCKHPFSFSPVYAENAPAKLPFKEFIIGISLKACHMLQFLLRLTFVLSVWLIIIPFITFWIWRFSFVRSFGEAQRLLLSHISATVILTDCLHGFLLSASIVFIFLGATSLRDYFHHLREVEGVEGDRNGARVARRPPNRNPVGENAGQVIGRNADDVAARLERQAARLEAHVEQMFDGLDGGDGAEDVPFDELVGMQGRLFHFVENALTVLGSNMIFIGVMILVPFHLGRLALYHLSWLLSATTSPMLSTIVPFTEQALSLANITFKNPDNNAITHVIESSNSIIKGETDNGSWVTDITTLAVGYLCIFSAVIFYFVTLTIIRYTKGEPLTTGRFYGMASIADTIPSLFKQFVTAMKHLLTMVKVAFLLVVELGVFPLMCGWWLDVCTVKMFGKSIGQRVDFLSVSPLSSSLIHWAVGIVYMLQISIFVSLLRGVLRNGVLYFLRDPTDPNYNPFRDLIDDPVQKHARRVLLSVGVYGSLIVMLVFLPVKLAMRIAPSIFPLDISISDPFTEIPANMLLFQICIPFAIEHFKMRATIKSLLRCWFTSVGWVLGLTDFLLPRPEGDPVGQDRVQARPQQDQAIVGYVGPRDMNTMMHAEADGREQSYSERDGFVVSIVLLLLAAWITLLVFNSALIVVPVSLGRALFNVVPLLPITHGMKGNDLYAFIIGGYIISTALTGARYSIDQIKTERATVLLGQIWKWCSIVVKSSFLLSICFFAIPVLIGLLFELLVIVPMRVPIDESPVFFVYQHWAFGLIFLKIWIQLVMLDLMAPLMDDSWRVKFERVRDNGFSRLQGFWVLREIVIPIVVKLLTALCFPYVLAKGVFPAFGYSLVVNSAVYRFAWVGCLGFSLVWVCGKRFHAWVNDLHNALRDERYLIGRRLHDFGDNYTNE